MTLRGTALREAQWARLTGAALLVAVVTFASSVVSLNFFRIPGLSGTIWWPVTGLVLLIVLRCPRRWWPVLLVVFVVANGVSLRTLASLPATASYSMVNVIEVLVAACLLREPSEREARGWRASKEATRFVMAIVLAIAMGIGLVALHVLIFGGEASLPDRILSYAITHVLGLFALAPMVLRGRVWRWAGWPRAAEFVLLLAVTIGIGGWLFLQPHAIAQAFPVLLPVIWASIRFDALQATMVSLLNCALVAYGTSQGLGPFAQVSDVASRQLIAQSLIATITATTLALVLITRHRERLAARARDSEKTLTIAIQEALVGIYSIRLDPGHVGEIREVNAAMCMMLGYEVSDLVGKPSQKLLAVNDRVPASMMDARIAQLAAGEIDAVQRETRFVTANGDELWVEVSVTRVTPSSALPFAFVYVHDLTGREQNKKMLEAMALTDALTGLPNRAVLFSRLDEHLFRTRRDGVPVGLLYLDLNGFKPVNDTHGHAAGDTVLVEVARRLERAVRPEDTVARLGGDEFAILVPGAESRADLDALADVVHAELSEPILLTSGAEASIGTAVGVALGTDEITADELVRAADEAMYRAKEASRLTSAAANR